MKKRSIEEKKVSKIEVRKKGQKRQKKSRERNKAYEEKVSNRGKTNMTRIIQLKNTTY